MFVLHEQLRKDGMVVGELPLSTLLLMNDANYPWFVLVPRREQVREWYELIEADQRQLLHETNALARFLQSTVGASKMNIGALGNMVPQLHVHVIARFEQDPAWPAPVWGRVPPRSYDEAARSRLVSVAQGFIATES